MPEISVLLPSLRPPAARQRVEEFSATNPEIDYEIVLVGPSPVAGDRVRHVLEETPRGNIAAMNRAYENSRAPYVAFWSDDVSPTPGCLGRMLAFVKGKAEPFIGAFGLANRAGRELEQWGVYGKLYACWGCMSRETLRRAGGLFDPVYKSFWADPDLALRVWDLGGRVDLCPDASVVIEHILDGVRNKSFSKYFDEDLKTFLNRWHPSLGQGAPPIWTLLNKPLSPQALLSLGYDPGGAPETEICPQEEFRALRNQGIERLALGDLTGAEKDLSAARKLNPGDAGVLIPLGKIYLENKNPEKALGLFKEALEIDPRGCEAWAGFAEIAKGLDDGKCPEPVGDPARPPAPPRPGPPAKAAAPETGIPLENLPEKTGPAPAGVRGKGGAKPRVLLIQLEFLTWERARYWSYGLQLGLEEGFGAAGVRLDTIPAFHGLSSADPLSWLSRAKGLCQGKRYDQVWVEIVQSDLDGRFLEWLAGLAPVRVAFLPESLAYHPEEWAPYPHLREREAGVRRRLEFFTHALTIDERDAEEINAQGRVRAMWCPAALPERFLSRQDLQPPQPRALFAGALYGERADWLKNPALKGSLVRPAPPEDATDSPRRFDRLNQLALNFLKNGAPVTDDVLATYLTAWRKVRREIFSLWIESLKEGCAVVNLPHFVKSYSGRVVEGMGAGRPVLSWQIPDRPRNQALFRDGEEILLFPREDPSALGAHIERVLRDPGLGRRLARNALERVRRWHTTEKRVEQILHWLETGEERVLGEEREPRPAPPRAEDRGSSPGEETARPVLRLGENGEKEPPSPLVSVVVPTFNRPGMLREALRSVVAQTYPHWEILVVNDGGEDVEGVVRGLNQKGKITYLKHDRNRGLAAARNTGIRLARGKYIAYLDDDDLYYPDHVETLLRFLEGSDYRAAYTDAYRALQKKEGGRYLTVQRDLPYSFDFDPDRILVTNFAPVLCFMHEKSCLEEVGFFDEELTVMEDWDLWIRLSRKFPIAHIARTTAEFTRREDGTTMSRERRAAFTWTRKIIYQKYRKEAQGRPRVQEAQEAYLKDCRAKAEEEYQRAQRLLGQEKTDEAISVLKELLDLSPDHSPARNDLGALYHRKGDPNRALEQFLQARKADPGNEEARKNLADLHLEMGRDQEALRLYREILAERPGDPDALLGLAHSSLKTGQWEDAQSHFAAVLQREPENAAARTGLESLKKASPGRPDPRPEEPPGGTRPREGGPAAGKRLVSIIVPAFNQVGYTRKCLEGLFTHTSHPFELIVVDNGSTDGTAKYLEGVRKGENRVGGLFLEVGEQGRVKGWRREGAGAASPGPISAGGQRESGGMACRCRYFRVIRNPENLGFPIGSNQGMAAAQGEYLLLLNNDTVVGPGWLDRLVALAEKDEKTGLVGPVSNFAFGPQQAEEIDYDPDSLEGLEAFSREVARENEGKGKPFWGLSGFCLLIKKAVVEKIGGLDSRYGLGNFEDRDFCLRAGLAGFECWVALDCFVHHFGSRTFAGAGVYPGQGSLRNWEIFKEKWSIPPDAAYGAPFDVSHVGKEGFEAGNPYCPLDPAKYLMAKGEEFFEQGQLEEARWVFEEVRRAAPQDPQVLNNLGAVAFHQGQGDRALAYFQQALERDSANGEAVENLGRALAAQGKWSEAVPWLERAAEARPQDLSLCDALANCLIQTGDFQRAQGVFLRSLSLDRGPKGAERVPGGMANAPGAAAAAG